jgi:hypothetical protein
VHLVSASQITKFRECERKWAWKYIAKLEEPSGPAAALGTEVDDTQLQPYLRDGRPLDFTRESGYIALPGLAFLPAPQSHALEVQKHFVMPSPTCVDDKHIGFGYQGFIDLWLPKGGMPGLECEHEDCRMYPDLGKACREAGGLPPVVCDFKTTGNWKYQKHPKDLETDVQAQLYAMWALWHTGSRVVDLVWVYFATRGKRVAKRSHLRVYAEHVAEQFTRINETALRMYEVRKTVTDPLELQPNPKMCDAYGGCPFRHKCNLSPEQTIDAQAARWVESNQMSNTTQATGTAALLSRLRAQKVGGASGYELSDKQTDGQAAADAGVAAVSGRPLPENIPEKYALGINPPESKLPPAPPVGVVVAHVSTGNGQSGPTGQPVSNPPAAALKEPVKRGPGRPKKDPLAADAAAFTEPTATDEAQRHQRIGALVVELAALLGAA